MPRFLLAALFLTITCLLGAPARAQAVPMLTGGTLIGVFFDQLRGFAADLEKRGLAFIDRGDIAFGQQQILFAGIITGLVNQFATEYAKALDNTLSTFSVGEQAVFGDLREQVAGIDALIKGGNTIAEARIYQMQSSANQLLDRLPGPRYPIVYGITAADLSPERGENPSDITIIGFHLSDPRLDRKPPVVTIDGETVPLPGLSLLEDRLGVQLPAPMKAKLAGAQSACAPRRTVSVEVSVFYLDKRLLRRPVEKTAGFHVNVYSSPDRYDVVIMASGTRSTTSLEDRSFKLEPPLYAQANCGHNKSVSAQIALPANAQEGMCRAEWRDMNHVVDRAQDCRVGGTVATISGTIYARDRNRAGNCPGNANGYLYASGTYKVPVETRTSVVAPRKKFNVRAPLEIKTGLDLGPALVNTTIDVILSRRGCQEPLDRMRIETNVVAARTEQSSEGGGFVGVLQNSQLRLVEKAP